ncbi:hypothetical protein ABH940_003423 [Streptacidiphilus sp. BW17]|uniref:hypothetical protein n=1 Tax=Streptacidiphilus sp. BW17 TaxID=3156274 RepID=UPI0035112288
MTSQRTAVIVYVCTAEDDAADLLMGHCARFATGQDWMLATAPIRDRDRQQPLAERPGWSLVLDQLAKGQAQGVVTYSGEMIHLVEITRQIVVEELLREGDWFLVTSRTPARPGPLPHRRPGGDSPASTGRRHSGTWPDAFTPRAARPIPAAS